MDYDTVKETHEIQYHLAIWTEDVTFTVWISEMSSLRVWFDFVGVEAHTGVVAARGNSCWSLISMSGRKPVTCDGLIPEQEVVDELVIGPHRRRKPCNKRSGTGTVPCYKPLEGTGAAA